METNLATDQQVLPDERPTAASGNFFAMASSYFMGVVNDNFFKQACMVLALAMSMQATQDGKGALAQYLGNLQNVATVIYTLPFILFAAYAGFLADRYSKRRIVIAAKLLELFAMLLGAGALLAGNWNLLLAMIFIMGLQATIFSPALNGTIPEVFPAHYVPRANAYMKVVSTAAILIGVAAGSGVMGLKSVVVAGVPLGQVLVAGLAVAVAVVGLVVSLGVPRRPAADPMAPFPVWGPLSTLRELARMVRDPLLAITIAIDTYVWFLGALLVLLINNLGIRQMRFGEGLTGVLVVAELVGIAVGGLIAGRASATIRWYRMIAPAAIGMGLALMGIVSVPYLAESWQLPAMVFLLAGAGVGGGILLIPLESFIQIRPPAQRKGTIIAAANLAAFTGILLSGAQSRAFDLADSPPTVSLAVMGLVTAGVGLILLPVLGRWRDE